MTPSVLVVAKNGERWGVSAGRELLALADSEAEAQHLAESAAEILRKSGGRARVLVAGEPRSFKSDDDD